MKSKKTKKALTGSVLALVLCFVMLLGTTFAWFTDTASTSVNKIQAGKLEVALEKKVTTDDGNESWVEVQENEKLNFVAKDGNTDILWEPGATYELPKLRVVNKGNLALKYKVVITGIDGSAKLNEAIDWRIDNEVIGTDISLGANESKEFTISGTIKKTAGNEYQGLEIKGVSITVYATQDTVEYDSNDNQYDKDATYYINKTGKKTGTSYNGTKVTLDFFKVEHEYDGSVSDGMAFYLYNGAELTVGEMDFSTTVKNDTGKRNIGFYLYNGSKLTINSGNFTMDGQWDALIWAQGGTNGERCTVTINGGTFKLTNAGANSTIVDAYSGSGYCGSDVYITGGFFDLSEGNANVTLQWKNDCTMQVTGGTFVNYNPKDHGVVPEGYTVETQAQSDGTTWYKVVPNTSTGE